MGLLSSKYYRPPIIPKRHVADFLGLTQAEFSATTRLIDEVRESILLEDSTVEGFIIGMNCGEVAGQTILHGHTHVVPRR